MASATSLFYNGIEIRNCFTRSYGSVAVYDQSGTDLLYHKFTFHVQGVVSLETLVAEQAGMTPFHGVVGNVEGATLAERSRDIQRKLLTPRQYFSYEKNGRPEVRCDATSDLNNGPHPLGCEIFKTSPAAVQVRFGIEVCVSACCNDGCEPPLVLNNRWSTVDDIGDQFQTIRRWKGRLRLSRPVRNIQSFREFCFPSVLKGWKRQGMQFVGDPNGLDFNYVITDMEMLGDAAPSPACKMTCRHETGFGMHSVDGESPPGLLATESVSVRLDGLKGCDRQDLVSRCAQVLQVKLDLLNWAGRKGSIIENVAFVDMSGEGVCAVEGHAQVRRQNDSAGKPLQFGMTLFDKFGKSLELPEYDPKKALSLGPYPSSIMNLFACYLQTPCDNNHAIPGTPDAPDESAENEELEENSYPEPTYQVGTVEDIEGPEYSSEHTQAIYTHYKVFTTYRIRHHGVQLPVASDSNSRGKPSIFIRLAPPTCIKTVKIEAERVGEWPTVIDAVGYRDLAGIWNEPYAEAVITPQPPEYQGDGRLLYAIDASYAFALERSPTASEKWATAGLPWDARTTEENAFEGAFVSPDDAQRGIG